MSPQDLSRPTLLKDSEITALFSGAVEVHVVASKQKADETLLNVAADPDVYVISNDRFRDFPDKAAVREHRLFTHEIVGGKVFINDLGVAEDF